MFTLAAPALLWLCMAAPPEATGSGVLVPRIEGEYVNVYKPAGDVFPGPSVGELIAGRRYEEWVPNDHCFVRDASGRWHALGITHPITDLENIHLGENQSFHAVAPAGTLKQSLREGAWRDLPKVLPPADRPGEIAANHAPCIVRRRGLYHMVYGPTPIRYAVSDDLHAWTPKGPLGDTPSGRDPSLLLWDGAYYLVTCNEQGVQVATSTDFQAWRRHKPIRTMQEGVDPESPSIVRHNNTFYLFVCGWNGVWDRETLQGAYQHTTYVYQSDDPLNFDHSALVTTLNAHAPEVFQDEQGDWYISSVEWPHRGVSIARLAWD
ncbi:Glycosyl hydrolases family 43 [Pirellulimonas nuda]|uniref:Glycosyl hydrolases family 43 n=1 Tax=Pirellulimonas nuda TaxID=2528009 RepID=A0A518DIG4_9BACT|nr:family 43 glycosylhydrolase [Pirellulimonas nuda]QDU91264.1 Glycosyl hydrolases family 43 [Pirellulimonas nuda]